MTSSSDENEFEEPPIAKSRSNCSRSRSRSKSDSIKIKPDTVKSRSSSNSSSKKSKKNSTSNGSNDRRSNGSKKRVKKESDDDGDGDDDLDFKPNSTSNGSTNVRSSSSAKKKRVKKEESDNENDFEPKKKKKKPAVKKKGVISKNRELKKLDKAERLSHAMQSFLWWDAPEPPEGCQWATMEHAGVSFTEPYKPHGVKMLYDGDPVDLNPVEEESATFFASMDPEGMHLGNVKTAPIFTKNFFADFRTVLGKKHIIKTFDKCDFEPIRRHLDQQKLIKKAITDVQKKENKDERNRAMFKFGYALVDGHIEKVGNYNMEPPSAFRGRGEHPKMGKLKTRVFPEQVSLNVSECSRIPACGVPGHAWGELRHDSQVQWLCQWKENINNSVKYMQLAAQSSFKGKSDMLKYNKAALLCDNIDNIRLDYKNKLKAKSTEARQLATAMWVIDRLALRVGGEKDTDEVADTVGCCTLRVEHLHFDPNKEGDDCKEIELEFLGKDSMLFKQTIDFGDIMYTENNGMGEQVFDNFQRFCKKKNMTDEVFDLLTPTLLNAHLKNIMDGLTAKVFRTYNASKTLQDELQKTEQGSMWTRLNPAEKVAEYNNANRQVAILCNHQRSVSKAQETQLENTVNKITVLKKQKVKLKKILKLITSGKDNKIPLKKDEKKMLEEVSAGIAKAKKMKESAKTNEQKIAATEADEKAKQSRRDITNFKFVQAHLWDKVPTTDQVVKKITAWKNKISKMEMDHKHKDDNKEVSLGTSKINYMDPRITVAWCKRNEIPIEKIFSKTLRDKFNWAMAVPPNWEFNAKIGIPEKPKLETL